MLLESEIPREPLEEPEPGDPLWGDLKMDVLAWRPGMWVQRWDKESKETVSLRRTYGGFKANPDTEGVKADRAYRIYAVNVHNSYSLVTLESFPNKQFNSTHFFIVEPSAEGASKTCQTK